MDHTVYGIISVIDQTQCVILTSDLLQCLPLLSHGMSLEAYGWKLISLWVTSLKVHARNLVSFKVMSLEVIYGNLALLVVIMSNSSLRTRLTFIWFKLLLFSVHTCVAYVVPWCVLFVWGIDKMTSLSFFVKMLFSTRSMQPCNLFIWTFCNAEV